YFRQESRKDPAWGCRRRWTEKRNRGCTGSRIRRIPASSSSRFPLRRLHLRQAATTFVQVVSPPRDRGSTWSTVRRSPRRLQYWHAYPSRRRMFFLLKATRSRNGLRMYTPSRMTAGSANVTDGDRITRGEASTGSAFPARRSVTARRALVKWSGSNE